MKSYIALIFLGLCLSQAASSLPCTNYKPLKVPLPGSSTLYIACSSGVTVFRRCSNELLFDAKTNKCIHPKDTRALPEQQKQQQQVVQCPDDFNPAAPAFIAHPTDCTRYFICVKEIAHEYQCPLGTKFNPAINVCDLAENVDCF
nr:peritrophin-1-like [Aedes albopictus]